MGTQRPRRKGAYQPRPTAPPGCTPGVLSQYRQSCGASVSGTGFRFAFVAFSAQSALTEIWVWAGCRGRFNSGAFLAKGTALQGFRFSWGESSVCSPLWAGLALSSLSLPHPEDTEQVAIGRYRQMLSGQKGLQPIRTDLGWYAQSKCSSRTSALLPCGFFFPVKAD